MPSTFPSAHTRCPRRKVASTVAPISRPRLLIAGPVLTNLIGAVGWRGTFWVMAVLGLVWAVVAIGLLLTVALIFISLGVGSGFVTGGIWWVASIDAEPGQPGSAAGFADAAFALAGIVAPAAMGFIVQSTGTFTSGFVLMSVLTAIGALLMLLATREPARTPQRAVEEV